MAVRETVFVSRAEATEWEDFVPPGGPDDILSGEPNAKMHWLRQDEEANVAAGLFTAQPSSASYVFPAHETFIVLEGEVDIEMADGRVVSLGPGDMASFRKGESSVWTYRSPFKKFVVLVQ